MPRQNHVTNLRQSDRAYRHIRGEVIRCELPPGTELTEASLAAQLGFGKAAVRAALMRLCQEGLARVLPRRGYVITPITVKDVLEIFELRMVIEPAIARLAAGKIDEDTLVQADLGWSQSYTANDTYVETSALQANKEFHLAIAQATGNSQLLQIQASILDQTERLIYLGSPIAGTRSEIQDGHKSLLSALSRGDSAGAEVAAAEHVQTAKAIVVDAIMSSQSVMGAEIAVQHSRRGTNE